jgi:putative nucleotidyltransferase with HDIG domain
MSVTGTPQAFELLVSLGATPRLVRHHELVVEAAKSLTELLGAELGLAFDRELVLLGAALHDAGKIIHPSELDQPGHDHEVAGRALLMANGVEPEVARFCVTHAAWAEQGIALEDLLVALADKLWKGKREGDLEAHASWMRSPPRSGNRPGRSSRLSTPSVSGSLLMARTASIDPASDRAGTRAGSGDSEIRRVNGCLPWREMIMQ